MSPCVDADWEAALALLFSNEPAERQAAEVRRLITALREGQADPSGIYQARRADQLVGVIRGDMLPGGVGFVWGPRLSSEESDATAVSLLQALEPFFDQRGATMVQALEPAPKGAHPQWYTAAGFHQQSDLLYLICARAQFPQHAPQFEGRFSAYTQHDRDRLIAVLERTYQDTLDFPILNFRRPTSEVLDGYLATGVFNSANWQFLQDDGCDVGCVLVNQHQEAEYCELVYMGLVPEARGRGWGLALVRQAQWIARQAKATQLVLGVDANNEVAVALYARVGFVEMGRRHVFLKFPKRGR